MNLHICSCGECRRYFAVDDNGNAYRVAKCPYCNSAHWLVEESNNVDVL